MSLAARRIAPDESKGWHSVPLDGAFEIVYRDEDGDYSIREVEAEALKLGLGRAILAGQDRLGGGYRGFRVDRIVRLVNLKTGKAVDRNIIDWLLKRTRLA